MLWFVLYDMFRKSNSKKIITWIVGVLLVLIVIIGAVAWYFGTQWKPVLSAKIKEGVYKGSNRLYQIDFKDIHLNLFSGHMTLDSVTLTPDITAVKWPPAHVFSIKLAHLQLKNISVLTAYFKREINIKSIVLDQPSIDMIYHKVPKKRDKNTTDSTFYQQISKAIKSIHISRIKLVDANFDYYNGSKKVHAVKHLMIDVRDILINSITQYDTTRVLNAKDLGFELSGYQFLTPDKMYRLKVDTIRGSINRKNLRIIGLQLIPSYADLAFSRKYNTQKDRYDLNFKTINFSGVDFTSLSTDGNLQVKRLTIGPAKVGVFMNRALPPPAIDKGRNYPHMALRRLPIATLIDTVSLNEIDIAYTEYNPKSGERGTLKLNQLSGNILNVTNDSLALTQHSQAFANLSAAVMGIGKLQVEINFNLLAKNGAFNYKGHIGAFDMKILNPLAKPLGLIEIESGRVQQADFEINANLKGSRGLVRFNYNDLKVNLLKEGAKNEVKEKKGLLSLLANTVLIKNDNPKKGEPARTAKISFERAPQASFFNLMWKSVFVGIREIVGVGGVPMKPMPAPINNRNGKTVNKEERKKH